MQTRLSPLEEFYVFRSEPFPRFESIEASKMPEPQRSLLAHKVDMTSTLETFYKQSMHVELLARHKIENEYGREVVLILNGDGRRVEFGAIRIFLGRFPDAAREEVLRERTPLGRILVDARIEFSSRPCLYFRITSDKFINTALGLTGSQTLHGRRNTLADKWDRPLAEIVEILPPA